MLTITLPYPPSVNSYWQHRVIKPRGKGRAFAQFYISEHGQAFRKNVIAAVLKQQAAKRLTCPVAVKIELLPPDRRTRDIDNPLKAIFDSLTHAGVWVDDKQVKRLSMEWGPVQTNGGMVVSIEEIPQAQGRLFDGK